MRNFKAVIFDMDGIIIDSELYWSKIEFFFAKSHGIKFNSHYRRQIMALSPPELAGVLRQKFGLSESVQEIIAERDRMAMDIYKEKAKLFPDFLRLITEIKKRELKTALASSSPHLWINPILKRFKLRKFFDQIISAEDLPSGFGKPHPEIYFFAAKKLQITPRDCLVLEDSVNGVKAAKAAGMFCVAVPGKWVKDRRGIGGADLVAKSLADKRILKILGNTNLCVQLFSTKK